MDNSDNIKKRIDSLKDLPYQEVFDRPLKEESGGSRIKNLLGKKEDGPDIETSAFVGLTIADMIYDYVRVDPLVMKASDFVRTEDLSNIFSFANFSENILKQSAESIKGNVSQIQGYVAEQFTAQVLQSSGFEVEFPELANQPGHDLLVGGVPYQVKCLASPQGVYDHIDKYPDIPVFVNAELAETFQDNPMVEAISQMSHQQMVSTTESSMEAAKEFLDFEIPFIAFAVTGGRQAFLLSKNRVSFEAALINTGVDGAGRVAGAGAGKYIGGGIGLVLGPYGAVVGSLIGAGVGAKTGKQATDYLKKKLLCQAEEKLLEKSISSLMNRSQQELNQRLKVINDKGRKIEELLLGKNTEISNALWKKFNFKLDQEMNYYKDKFELFKTLSENPRKAAKNEDIISSSMEVIYHFTNVRIPHQKIRSELEVFQNALKTLKSKRDELSI